MVYGVVYGISVDDSSDGTHAGGVEPSLCRDTYYYPDRTVTPCDRGYAVADDFGQAKYALDSDYLCDICIPRICTYADASSRNELCYFVSIFWDDVLYGPDDSSGSIGSDTSP